MSGSIVPVAVGAPTQISGSNVNDTTIYNTSTTQAVWVSNSTSVSPGNGMRIGPLGTARWSKASGLAYACVDTGVITPINLNISNDISDPANPVDVATATAVALLAQGVPNVLVTKVLAEQAVAAGNTLTVDVSGYASIALFVDGQTNGNLFLSCQFFDPTSPLVDIFTLSAPFDASNASSFGTWEMPVTSSKFQLAIPAGSPTVNVLIVGSNRPVPTLRQRINSYLPRLFNFTGNLAAGGFVQMTASDGIVDNESRFNGPVKLSILGNAASHAAPGFLLIAEYAGIASVGAGALNQINIFPNSTVNEIRDWYHPPVPVQWWIEGGVAAAGSNITLSVTPAGSGF